MLIISTALDDQWNGAVFPILCQVLFAYKQDRHFVGIIQPQEFLFDASAFLFCSSCVSNRFGSLLSILVSGCVLVSVFCWLVTGCVSVSKVWRDDSLFVSDYRELSRSLRTEHMGQAHLCWLMRSTRCQSLCAPLWGLINWQEYFYKFPRSQL